MPPIRLSALRAHALLVASEGLQTVSKVVAVLVRDKHADGRFSYGYGSRPVHDLSGTGCVLSSVASNCIILLLIYY